MTTKLAPRCAACLEPLVLAPRGHGKRFCGAACRVAAYRRRQQKISEKAPRWEHPRGRLRLSRARVFDRRQAELTEWRRQRDERREQDRKRSERMAAERAKWQGPRPRNLGELAEMQAELARRADAAERATRAPLPDDWMFRR